MREFIFRCKEAGGGEWVYGDLITLADREDICGIKEVSLLGVRYLCNKKTLGEYTGLTDKNGKKIFEGDIIKVITEDTHEERFIEVCFGEFTDDGSGDLFIGAYLKYDNYTVSAGQIKECESAGVEVVGNIYDNPELLK